MTPLQVGFIKMVAYPIYPDKVYLEWAIGPDSDPGNYSYKIYRSGSPEGPWEVLTSHPVTGAPTYVDVNVDLLSKYREVYYFVEAISGRGTVYTSPVKNLVRVVDRDTYAKAVEINRLEMLLLRQYSGVEVHLFKKKHFGERCPDCYESITRTTVIKNCQTCAGTGFTNGYYKAIKTYSNITPDTKVNIDSSEFETQPSRATAWITAYPVVAQYDILVEADTNRRWVIRNVQNTELRRYIVKQTMDLRELPRSDIEYSLALDFCLDDKSVLNEIPDHGRPGPTRQAAAV